jgi:hypothetical protein
MPTYVYKKRAQKTRSSKNKRKKLGAKVRNLMAQKERKSASAKGSAREREIAIANAQEMHVPSSVNFQNNMFSPS